eukprot:gene13188-9546_t
MSETNWTKYGLLRSPMEELGMDDAIYKSGKKTDLYTNTKDYVTERNNLLGSLSKDIDESFKKIMENDDLKKAKVPLKERQRLAFEASRQKKAEILKIVDEVYPMADMAYKQASSISNAQNVVDGNLLGSTASKPKKKSGRPRKTANINLDDIKIENENEFIELNEEKPINKPKRKYKKREYKNKNTENEIKNNEIENKNEFKFENENENNIKIDKNIDE